MPTYAASAARYKRAPFLGVLFFYCGWVIGRHKIKDYIALSGLFKADMGLF